MTVHLKPSFLRSSCAVLIAIAAVSVLPYLWQGYYEHHWWSRGYMLSLLVPAVFCVFAVWLMFVPVRLEFDDTHFTIQLPLRRPHTLPWEELKYYGPGQNVFMIQFAGREAFQIFARAFPRDQWRLLTNFLSDRFPDCKASGWIGPFMFKWRKNK